MVAAQAGPAWRSLSSQHPIGPYVLDFYCASARLCVEIDGPSHADQSERDDRRTEWLVGQGIRVLRFSPNDLDARPAAVLRAIAQAAPLSTTPSRGPPLPQAGEDAD
jgi:very-short-patch-repair endonuclease